MSKRVTIKNVADYVGVSTATISYYLNGRYENMSEEMRRQIDEAIKTLHYQPSNVARSLRVQKTRTIGVIVPGLRGNIGFQTVNGVCEILNEEGYDTSIFFTNDSSQQESKHLQQCMSNRMEGIIVVPTVKADYSLMREIQKSGPPIVVVSRYNQELWPYDSATLDYAGGVVAMMEHLAQKGFTRVAFLVDMEEQTLEEMSITKHIRRDAFVQAAERLFRISAKDHVYYNIRKREQARAAIEDFACRFPDEKKAVFAINSPTMILAYRALRDLGGIRDIELCGYGGPDWLDLMEPLPVILTQPLKDVGRSAAELMIRRLKKPQAEPKAVFLSSEILDPTEPGFSEEVYQ